MEKEKRRKGQETKQEGEAKVMRIQTEPAGAEAEDGTGSRGGGRWDGRREMKARVDDDMEEGNRDERRIPPLVEPRCRPRTGKTMSAVESLDEIAKHLTTNKAQLFPTTRRPATRELSNEKQEVMDEWGRESRINVFEGLTEGERRKGNQLLYAWKDVFENDILRIRTTDLIEHGIDLKPDATPS